MDYNAEITLGLYGIGGALIISGIFSSSGASAAMIATGVWIIGLLVLRYIALVVGKYTKEVKSCKTSQSSL